MKKFCLKNQFKKPFTFAFNSKFNISSSIPIIDLDIYLNQKRDEFKECKKVVEGLHSYGAIIVKAPKFYLQSHNEEFLDLMEDYFQDRSIKYYSNQKVPELFPEYGYQTGIMPEFTEQPVEYKEEIEKLSDDNKSWTPIPSKPDAKWRYFWRIGARPPGDRQLDPPRCVPNDFIDFTFIMDRKANKMMQILMQISEMAAIGLGIQEDEFVKNLMGGAHTLAPTGSDLGKYEVGQVLSGFHLDYNFLTIHGKSRYPGLYIWLRTGQKMKISIPDGYLLIQAGKQIEHLTGGHFLAGYHEVVLTQEAYEKAQKRKNEGLNTWRISSTLFANCRHDVKLKPIEIFRNNESLQKYPEIEAYKQIQSFLNYQKMVQNEQA